MNNTITMQLRRAALMLLYVTLTSITAWAQNEVRNESSTKGNYYFEIWNEDRWNEFAAAVANGTTFYDQAVLLYADLDISTMVGTAEHPFCGRFYGGGHENLRL